MHLQRTHLVHLTTSAMFLALALVLPFLTGQIPEIGQMLCPMHFPIFLCAFFCGPYYAALIGFVAPPLRFLLFGMPPLLPTGLAMAFELLTYGLAAGILYRLLKRSRPGVYVSLLGAMIAGRVVWAAVRVVFYAVGHTPFGWAAFLAGAFTTALPGIIAQIVLIPLLVYALDGTYKKILKG